MAYFKNITIVKCNYFYGFSTTPFIGHVGTKGIFLLWENYEHEFRDYSDLQHEKSNILDSYDATGYDECWPGSAENLLKRPQALKSELRELFIELALLLNQDPFLKIFSTIQFNGFVIR